MKKRDLYLLVIGWFVFLLGLNFCYLLGREDGIREAIGAMKMVWPILLSFMIALIALRNANVNKINISSKQFNAILIGMVFVCPIAIPLLLFKKSKLVAE